MIFVPQPKIFLSLKANDTTIIHRAGITGLWMSLKVLEQKYPDPLQRPGHLTWDLTATSISLNWQGEDLPVLNWLLQQSFQIDEDGLIKFTGLESCSLTLINRIHNHKAINDTFLKLHWFYKKRKVTSQSFKINNIRVFFKYKQLNSYAHQTLAEKLCNKSGNLIDGYIPIVSWLYPGATVRHAILSKFNKIEEKVEYALALLFLPLVCQYYILQENAVKTYDDRLTKYLIVIPEVYNLETAAVRCWNFQSINYVDLYVASLAEAALKYYHYTQGLTLLINNVECCQVLLYEKLNKKSRQRAIFDVQDFTITPQSVKDYQFICQHFAKNIIFFKKEGKRKSFIVKVNSIRSIIASNLADNLPWWTDFWENIYETNSLGDIEEQLVFNRKGLLAMIEEDAALEIYQDFIHAFHEALRKIYAKTYDKKKSKKDNQSRIEKKYESIRSELARCYDQQSLEDFLSDFLARAGLNSALYNQWSELLPLIFNEVNWQRTRNLALISLASYKPKRFSLRKIPIKFWTTLISINYQAAIFFLYEKPITEIFLEKEEILQ
ncbi:MAG: type I-MYXAN CRISPR-associated Cas8a1/Cmx1 [Xenococcaceae cyanobacterium MO_188.B29]|nr:type I-MYXAN CRISPR-associated Cas8a1/Cmx1 [Xenococcaceae cyanobacterium MO_188.B29]